MKEKRKMIVLQGPPASGKSTYARELVAQDPLKYIIVCRDELRAGTGTYWKPEHEDYITVLEESGVKAAMDAGYVPIVDATNLNSKTIEKWKRIANDYKADIEWKEFYIPFKEALERDTKRGEEGGRAVGKKVLERFYRNYYPKRYAEEQRRLVEHPIREVNPELPYCVIFDIDGTLAWMNDRNPYDLSKVKTDKPDVRLFRVLEYYHNHGMKVIIFSGREGTLQCFNDTLEWLKANSSVDEFELHMRPQGDFRGDEIIKQELYDRYIANRYNVLAVYDDRDKVVDMWRNAGILCCQVERGDF